MNLTKSMAKFNVVAAGLILAAILSTAGVIYNSVKYAAITLTERRKQNFYVKDACVLLCENPCTEIYIDDQQLWQCEYYYEPPMGTVSQNTREFYFLGTITCVGFLTLFALLTIVVLKQRKASKKQNIIIEVKTDNNDFLTSE